MNDTWLILPNSENLIKKAGTSLWNFIAQNYVPQLDNNTENSEISDENSLKRRLERSRRDFTNVLHVMQIKLRNTKSTDSSTPPEFMNWINVGEKEIDVMMKETGFKLLCDWNDDSHKWIYEGERETITETKGNSSLRNSAGKKIDVPRRDRGSEKMRNAFNNNARKRLSDNKAEQLKNFLNQLKHGEIKSNGCKSFFFQ